MSPLSKLVPKITGIVTAYTSWYIEKSGLWLMLWLGMVWLLTTTVEFCSVENKYWVTKKHSIFWDVILCSTVEVRWCSSWTLANIYQTTQCHSPDVYSSLQHNVTLSFLIYRCWKLLVRALEVLTLSHRRANLGKGVCKIWGGADKSLAL
jgi:uncharacterized membrane protein